MRHVITGVSCGVGMNGQQGSLDTRIEVCQAVTLVPYEYRTSSLPILLPLLLLEAKEFFWRK